MSEVLIDEAELSALREDRAAGWIREKTIVSLREQLAQAMTPAPPALPPEPDHLNFGRFMADNVSEYIEELRAAASGLVEENQRLQQCLDRATEDGCSSMPKVPTEWLAAANQRAEAAESAAQAARERIAELEDALRRILDGIPACGSDGSLYIEHFDGEGNSTGTEYVDPLAVIQSIHGIAQAAIDAALPPSSETTKAL